MARRLLNLLAILSLLFCLAAAGLWVASHRTVFIAHGGGERYSFVAETQFEYVPTPGRMTFEWTTEPAGDPGLTFVTGPVAGIPHVSLSSAGPVQVRQVKLFGGFAYRREDWPRAVGLFGEQQPGRSDTVVVPLWSVMLLTLVLPALRLLAQRRARRRVKAGRCAACGYDLRATPGRCPECGTEAI